MTQRLARNRCLGRFRRQPLRAKGQGSHRPRDAGVISAEDWAGYTWLMEHRGPQSMRAARHSANLAITCITHWIARIVSARQRGDIDNVWIPGRGRAIAGRRERARPWPLVLPTSDHPETRAHVCRQRLRARLHALSAPRAFDTRWVPWRSRRQSAWRSATNPA